MCSSQIVFGVRTISLFERPVKYMGSPSVINCRIFITKSIPKEVGKNTWNIAASEEKKSSQSFVKILGHTLHS